MSKSSEEGAAGNASGQNNIEGANDDTQKDGNGNIYEDRAGTKKIIRVVTVMAYVFSVSFAAILLSAYYVFLWEPPNPRLQHHPLTSEPQADYLIDNVSPIELKVNKPSENVSEYDKKFENYNLKNHNNIFKRIMTSEKEVINYPQKLVAVPKDLQVSEDLSKPDDGIKSEESSTTLKKTIPNWKKNLENNSRTLYKFFKASTTSPNRLTKGNESETIVSSKFVGRMPRLTLSDDVDSKIGKKTKKLVDNKTVDISLRRDDTSKSSLLERHKDLGYLESTKISAERNESDDSILQPEISNNETTSTSYESNTLNDILSAEYIGSTIHPGIDNYSYSETIGVTVKNNKVTMGNEITTEISTSRKEVVGVPDLQDDNFDMALRKQEDSMSSDKSRYEKPTLMPEVQIYPEEIGSRDIFENEK